MYMLKKRRKIFFLLVVLILSFSFVLAQENNQLNIDNILNENPDAEIITVDSVDVGMQPGEYSNKNGVKLIVLGEETQETQETDEEVELNNEILEFDYFFDDPVIEKIEIDKVVYDSVTLEDTNKIEKLGEPVLPFKTIKLLVPQDATVTGIIVEGFEKTEIPGTYLVEPAQQQYPLLEDIEIKTTRPNNEVYSSKEPYIKKINDDEKISELAGYKIVYANIYPVNYVPGEGTLSYYKKLNVKVGYELPGIIERTTDFFFGEKDNFRDLEEDEERVEKLVDNPNLATDYEEKPTPLFSDNNDLTGFSIADPADSYDYVIITNQEFKNYNGSYSLYDLINKKQEKGLSATIVTVENIYSNYEGRDNPEKIRNFIKDAYLNWDTQYILLAGDADGADVGGESGDNIVPIRKLWVKRYNSNWEFIPSDVYYSNLDGSFNNDGDNIFGEQNDGEGGGEVDLIADVYVGRAPIDSTVELSNFVRKTLLYEQAILDEDAYLEEILMVGEYLGFGGVSDYAKSSMEEIRLGSTNHGYTTKGLEEAGIYNMDTLYDQDSTWPKSSLVGIINNNIFAINHLGHANVNYAMKMYNSDADSLQNTKPFFLYSQGCLPGSLDNYYNSYKNYDSMAEHLIGEDNGAFAAILNARYGWGRSYSTDGASQRHNRRFIHAITEEEIYKLSRANAYAKEGLIGYISSESCSSYSSCLMRGIYWETNLFGDPEVSFFSPAQREHNLRVARILVPARITANSDIEVETDILNKGLNNENNILVDFYVNNAFKESKTISQLSPDNSEKVIFNWHPGGGGDYDLKIYVHPVVGEDYLADNEKAIEKQVIATQITNPLDLDNFDTSENTPQIMSSKNSIEIKGVASGDAFTSYTLKWCDKYLSNCQTSGISLPNNGQQQVKDDTLGYWNVSEDLESDFYYLVLTNNYGSLQEEYEIKVYVESDFQAGDWPKNIPPEDAGGGWVYSFVDQLTISDIDNDGAKEILFAYGDKLRVFESDGSYSPGFPYNANFMQYGPAVADVDGDGIKEIVVKDYRQTQIIKANGEALPGWPKSLETYGTINLEDFGNDGEMELIFRNWDVQITAVDINGNIVPGWPVSPPTVSGYNYFKNIITPVNIADLDGDGDFEVIVTTYSCNRSDYCIFGVHSAVTMSVYDEQGNMLPAWPKEFEASSYRNNIVADINNDGFKEILTVAYGDLQAFDINGNEIGGFPFRPPNYGDIRNFLVADFDNDAKLEVAFGALIGKNCLDVHEYENNRFKQNFGFPVCYRDTIDGKEMSTMLGYSKYYAGSLSGEDNQIVISKSSPTTTEDPLPELFFINADGSIPNNTPKKINDYAYPDSMAIGDMDNDGDNELMLYLLFAGDFFVWDLEGTGKNKWPMKAHDPKHTGTYSSTFADDYPLYLVRHEFSDITPYSFNLELETSNPTNVVVNVLENGEVVRNITHQTMTKNHSILVDGLEQSTRYSYRIIIKDEYNQVIIGNADSEFYTRTTSKIPALPTNTYGLVKTTDEVPVEGIEVTAYWTDIDDNSYESKTTTMNLQGATEFGDSDLVGYFSFNQGEIKAKKGTKIQVSAPEAINEVMPYADSNPGGRAVEINEPILLSGEPPEINIAIPESREYSSNEMPILLNYNASKTLKSAYYTLNNDPPINILENQNKDIVLNTQIGTNILSINVTGVANIKNSGQITFSVIDASNPNVTLNQPVYAQDKARISAFAIDDLSALSTCEVCISNDNVCDTEWETIENNFNGYSGTCNHEVLKSTYSDGDYVFNFRVTDASNNKGTGTFNSLVIDSVAPSEVKKPKAESISGQASIKVSWETSNAPDFKEYRVYKSSSPEELLFIIPDINQVSFTDTNVEELTTYKYRITVVDDYLNQNAGVNVSSTVDDITPPTVNIQSPSLSKTYTTKNVTLTYTVSEPATCYYGLNGINYSSASTTEIISAIEGTNNVFVFCDDGFNIGSSQLIIFYVDTKGPDPEYFIKSERRSKNVVRIFWGSVMSADSFSLYRDTKPFYDVEGMTPVVNTIDLEYLDTSIVENQTYFYAVSTIDENGNENKNISVLTNITIVPMDDGPIDDLIVEKVFGEDSFFLEWSEPGLYNRWFNIYVDTTPFNNVEDMTPAGDTGDNIYYLKNLPAGTNYVAVSVIDRDLNQEYKEVIPVKSVIPIQDGSITINSPVNGQTYNDNNREVTVSFTTSKIFNYCNYTISPTFTTGSIGGCSDIDFSDKFPDGKNIYVRGEYCDPYAGGCYYDECSDNNQVKEYYCFNNGNSGAGYITCPEGYTCSKGACKRDDIIYEDILINQDLIKTDEGSMDLIITCIDSQGTQTSSNKVTFYVNSTADKKINININSPENNHAYDNQNILVDYTTQVTPVTCNYSISKHTTGGNYYTCSDTDIDTDYPDGKNLFVKGYACNSLNGGCSDEDSCLYYNDSYVEESYCALGSEGWTNFVGPFKCPDGYKCKDGACVLSEMDISGIINNGQTIEVFGGQNKFSLTCEDTSGYKETSDEITFFAGNQTTPPSNLTCIDGTNNNMCSVNKPKLCVNGSLIDNCEACGCDANYDCINNSCIYSPPENDTDTTPPAKIENLVVSTIQEEFNLNLSWNKNSDEDFNHYNIYRSDEYFSGISEDGSLLGEIESMLTEAMDIQKRDAGSSLLNDGRVLIVGGYWASALFGRSSLEQTEIFSPPNNENNDGVYIRGPNMYYERRWPNLVTLKDGRVLVVGGQTDWYNVPRTEIFDSTANGGEGEFTRVEEECEMEIMHQKPTLTLLNDGRVLVAGGADEHVLSNTAHIFNPDTNCFTKISDMSTLRFSHTANLLNNGKVFILGGISSKGEIFDPETNTFTQTNGESIRGSRTGHSSVLLGDGRVLIAGGYYTDSVEIYDPITDTFTEVPGGLNIPRGYSRGYLLPDNRAMFIGGFSDSETDLQTVEIYDPATNSFSISDVLLKRVRGYSTSTQLKDSRVLLAGAYETGDISSEIYGILASGSADLIDQINNQDTNIYLDLNLTSGQTYYYGITAVDDSENEDKDVVSVAGTVYQETPIELTINYPENNQDYNTKNLTVDYSVNKEIVSCNYTLNSISYELINNAIIGVEGPNNLFLICKDNQGKTGISNSVTFNIDTVSPPQVQGLNSTQIENTKNIVLSWQPYWGLDFSHYNIYRSDSFISDVTGLTPVAKKTSTNFTDINLNLGTYYYAVTAADKSLNENTSVVPLEVEVIELDTNPPGVSVYSVGEEVYGTVKLVAGVWDDKGLSLSCEICISSDGVCDTEWVSGINDFNKEELFGNCSFVWDTSLFEKRNYTYNFRVSDLSSNIREGISKSTNVIEPPPQTCFDGTIYGECSTNKPLFCDNGTLIDSCLLCGCDFGYVCNPESGSCFIPNCSDGTVYGECSTNKPLFCNNGTLINDCTTCGCNQGYFCNLSTEDCDVVPEEPELNCSDGTPFNSCSFNKPKYCSNGTLINKCTTCSCSEGYICENQTEECIPEPSPSLDVALYSGWNIFTVPLGVQDTGISSVLSGISGKYNSVFSYDANTKNWLSYKANKTLFDGSDSLAILEPGKGYWIEMIGPATITFQVPDSGSYNKVLSQGWNFIGHPYLESRNIDSALSSLNNNYDIIYSYDNQAKKWLLYSPYSSELFNNTLNIMEPGKGYWIYLYESSSWQI